jgi:hypothetical protein
MRASESSSGDGQETVVSTTHAEIVDADDADTWSGPHTEYNRYGEPTGHEYVRCRACGVEVVSGREHAATHRGDCRHDE